MRDLRILVATMMVCAAPAMSQLVEGGASSPDTPWKKSKDGFGAMLALTDKPQDFVQEWQSTAPQHKPAFHRTSRVRRNRQVVAFVFFSGCMATKGLCDCSVIFEMLKPDGSAYGEPIVQPIWRGAPGSKTDLQLSAGNLAITIEDKDPLGIYRIKAKVKDNVAGIVLELEVPFEAIAQ